MQERYTVHQVLGRGGMGVVYEAHDVLRQQTVALKRLAVDKFQTPNERSRATALFEREYHTLSQLAHPQIIEVFDYGLDESGPYYTMELLRGETLRALAPMPVATGCRFARDIASALAILHSRRLVHRDVTPLNIHCTPDGRAKLIDFGAMMPIGVPKQVVGTPAFIAPECLQLQILDGQADLYSLGACLYFALTGRHAYRARSLNDLRDAWQAPPVPASQIEHEIPEALDRLLLSLLSLQPASRPRTAAEVFERLTAIAGLPAAEQSEVAEAYVTNPALVGRQAELSALRRGVVRAVRKRGGSVLVTGGAGAGKSRLLDSAVLEAQLAGAAVARADASDCQGIAFGAARRIIDCIVRVQPDLQTLIDQHELSAGPSDVGASARLDSAARQRTMAGATEVVSAAVQRQAWVIVVDDLHLIDEPSFALLATLAVQARKQRLLLVTSADPDAATDATSAMTLLSETSRHLALLPLDPAGARALLSSLFGEVPNLELLCTLAERNAQGNPRQLMDWAERLIERRLVRYDSGAWLISSDPAALEAALATGKLGAAELARLSIDALEMLDVLSLDRDNVMSLADYALLLEHGDATRMNRALDELIGARILMPYEERVRFYRADVQRGVAQNIELARRQELHRRLAERCCVDKLPGIYAAYHFLLAGLPQRAIEPISEFVVFIEDHPNVDLVRYPVTLDTLETIARLPPHAQVPAAFCAEQGAGMVLNAMYRGLPERVVDQLGERSAALAPFSGLSDYAASAHLDEQTRLTQALTAAAQRCDASGLANFTVIHAIRRHAQVCMASAVCAHFMADPTLLQKIPDLRPYAALSPALSQIVDLIDALRMLVRGQSWEAWDVLKRAYATLRGPLKDQLRGQGLTLLTLERVTLAYLCALEADHATDDALRLIEEYTIPNVAESHRARYLLASGDLPLEEVSRKRFEVLSVQGNSLSDMRVMELPPRLLMYALSDDLMGLRHTLDAIRDVAARRPRWQIRALLAEAHLLRCRGLFEKGLAVIDRCLARIDPEQGDWLHCAAARLELLVALRRFETARDAGQDYVVQANTQRVPAYALQLTLALAHAQLGNHAQAEALFAASQRPLFERGCLGVVLGRSFETGARIALCQKDRATFAERSARCAELYRIERHPSLAGRYGSLLREAHLAGFGPALSAASDSPLTAEQARIAALRSAVVKHNHRPDFFAQVLKVVVEQVGATGGVLYTIANGGLRRVAEASDIDSLSDLDREVERFHQRELEADEDTTASTEAPHTSTGHTIYTTTGSALVPYLLAYDKRTARTITGVVVFAIQAGTPRRSVQGYLETLAEALSDRQEIHSTALTSQDATRVARFGDRRN